MSYNIQNGEAYQALNDAIQTWKTDGYGVVDVAGGDCVVTVSSGTLDGSDTLSVAPGEIADNGTTVSVGSQTVGINSVGSGYRYDTVWIDSNGTAQVTEGTATQLSQAEIAQNLSRFELFTPTIPFPSTTPATVIAVVAVNDSDSSITSANLQDRRVAATVTTTDLTSESVNTGQVALDQSGVKFLPAGRDFITTEETTVNLSTSDTETVTVNGADYEYWIIDVPYFVAHDIDYQVPSGTHDIHIFVPPHVVSDSIKADAPDGAVDGVRIKGATGQSNASNYKVQSLTATGCTGAVSPKVFGLSFQGVDPTSDENPAVSFYGCQNFSLDQCDFTGNGKTATSGVLAYSSAGTVEGNTDLGASDLDYGVQTKHNGYVITFNNGMQGSVDEYVFNVSSGIQAFKGNDVSATGSVGTVRTNVGVAFDTDAEVPYGFGPVPDPETGNYTSHTVMPNAWSANVTTTATAYEEKTEAWTTRFDRRELQLSAADDQFLRFRVDLVNDTVGETTSFRLIENETGDVLGEVSMQGTTHEYLDSGYIDISEYDLMEIRSEMKVSGGQGTLTTRGGSLRLAAKA